MKITETESQMTHKLLNNNLIQIKLHIPQPKNKYDLNGFKWHFFGFYVHSFTFHFTP